MILTSLFIVIAATLATIITRLSPLWISNNIQNKKSFIYLSEVLPLASFGLLVVYSLKGISFTESPFGLIELFSVAVIILVQLKKDNVLLSIFLGTAVYMILINL